METSPLICSANQWSGFYMITVSVMKELNHEQILKKIPSFDRKIFISDSVKTNLWQEHVKYLNKSSFILNL